MRQTNQIVTEIIVDAEPAEAACAIGSAAMRAAQREFDKTIAKIKENTAANNGRRKRARMSPTF